MASLADCSLDALLDDVAAQRPAPGAGSATAVAAALAAALVEMTAAFTLARPEHAGTAERTRAARERAVDLRAQALALAERELGSYAPVLEALRLAGDDPERPARLRAALASAAQAPLEIAAAAAIAASLAAELAVDGNRHLRGEALAATILAEAACRAAVALVDLDLDGAGDGTPGVAAARARARELAREAAAARERALEG